MLLVIFWQKRKKVVLAWFSANSKANVYFPTTENFNYLEGSRRLIWIAFILRCLFTRVETRMRRGRGCLHTICFICLAAWPTVQRKKAAMWRTLITRTFWLRKTFCRKIKYRSTIIARRFPRYINIHVASIFKLFLSLFCFICQDVSIDKLPLRYYRRNRNLECSFPSTFVKLYIFQKRHSCVAGTQESRKTGRRGGRKKESQSFRYIAFVFSVSV